VIVPLALRKLVLAFHLTCSVGWLGAVVAYFVLDLTVASSEDPQLVRAAWLGMSLVVSCHAGMHPRSHAGRRCSIPAWTVGRLEQLSGEHHLYSGLAPT
jgi:hypothetical protein